MPQGPAPYPRPAPPPYQASVRGPAHQPPANAQLEIAEQLSQRISHALKQLPYVCYPPLNDPSRCCD